MTIFQEAVLHIVRLVPPGQVVSYGQVAAYLGTPRAARQVGWALHSMEDVPDFPWWRVINNSGHITIKGSFFNTPRLQKELLEKEGVKIASGEGYQLDINRYRFKPDSLTLGKLGLQEEYVHTILDKYAIG